MKIFAFGCAIAASTIPALAFAGDTVLYQPAPDWVTPADFDSAAKVGKELVLAEQHIQLGAGQTTTFSDVAYLIKNPATLTEVGTLKLNWQPDKGDLVVHSLQIVRAGEVIDLLANGVRYEVLRREAQLEKRSIDGTLTATLAVPGLKVGDILRFSQSITRKDQALGENVQAANGLLAKPIEMGSGRLRVSWPSALGVAWKASPGVVVPAPVESDGNTALELVMPIAKPAEMPEDAPARFTYGPLLQATTFDSWQDVSRTLAPHFAITGTIAPGGAIDKQVSAIAAKGKSPLERAALALRLVQDDISYLMNGLNGGNYLPQSPAETWEARYGDCKAKSLLLLAMLEKMGIEAEAVLVRSREGDAVSAMLPMPGNFDHMIVRATIDG